MMQKVTLSPTSMPSGDEYNNSRQASPTRADRHAAVLSYGCGEMRCKSASVLKVRRCSVALGFIPGSFCRMRFFSAALRNRWRHSQPSVCSWTSHKREIGKETLMPLRNPTRFFSTLGAYRCHFFLTLLARAMRTPDELSAIRINVENPANFSQHDTHTVSFHMLAHFQNKAADKSRR